MSNKVYVLQKDYSVPGMLIPAGTESTTKDNSVFCFCNGKQCKLFSLVEVEKNHTDFFKLKEEPKEEGTYTIKMDSLQLGELHLSVTGFSQKSVFINRVKFVPEDKVTAFTMTGKITDLRTEPDSDAAKQAQEMYFGKKVMQDIISEADKTVQGYIHETAKEERIVITSMYDLNNIYQPQFIRTGFTTSKPIPEDKFPAIRKAIENVVNGGGEIHWTKYRVPFITDEDGFRTYYSDNVVEINDKGEVKECQPKYTEEQMKLCDDNAYWRGANYVRNQMLTDLGEPSQGTVYLQFEDFLNSLKQPKDAGK